MEDFKIENRISSFLTSIDDRWISLKRKEFEANPFYDSSTEQLIIVDSTYDYEPIFEYEAESRKSVISGTKYVTRREVFDFQRYCIEYYNRGDYSSEEQSTYAWIGYCELEKSGKSTQRLILPNLMMLIMRLLIEDLSEYFNTSIHSKVGLIRAIRELVLVFDQEVKRLQRLDESDKKVISGILTQLSPTLEVFLTKKYGAQLSALSRPFHSKYTLDFDIDRTELAAVIYLLIQSGLLSDSKENLEFCFEHLTFKKKNEKQHFTTMTNFTNVLGEIKKGKSGAKYHKLETVIVAIQDAIIQIKNP